MCRVLNKIISILGNVLCTILSIVLIAFLLMQLFNYKIFVVTSGSMETTIKTGSIIIADCNVKGNDVEENDIVVFDNGTLVVHRAINVDKNRNKIETKGDANTVSDGYIDFSQIKGKEKYSIPYLGYVFSFIKNNLITTLALIVSFFLLNMILGIKENNKIAKNNF